MDNIQEYLLDPCIHPPPEIERFLVGDCDLFAIATHRLTGWDIIAIIEPRLSNMSEQIGLVHAVCIKDRHISRVFDAKGWRDFNSMSREYEKHEDCYVTKLTEHELHKLVHPDKSLDEDELTKIIAFIKRYYQIDIGGGHDSV